MRCNAVLAVVGLLGAMAPAHADTPAGRPGDYGRSHANPVEVCRPDGARRYFERLVCPSGERAAFTRLGSMDTRTPLPADMTQAQVVAMIEGNLAARPLAQGEPDYHVLDGYQVECGDTGKTLLCVDAYHCGASPPPRAPDGFRFAPRSDPGRR